METGNRILIVQGEARGAIVGGKFTGLAGCDRARECPRALTCLRADTRLHAYRVTTETGQGCRFWIPKG
jgi:hypothetical protein